MVYSPSITPQNANWYRGTADSIYQNIQFLRDSHEPYVVIASGDGVYKLDYGKVLEYHIARKADITMVCKKMTETDDLTHFGLVKTDGSGRILDIDEKPMVATSDNASLGIYVIRRHLLMELLEQCAEEGRYDFVRDILMRYKNVGQIYAYQMEAYWGAINSVEAYYKTNMDFLKPEVRDYFFHQYPDIYSKVEDNPPAKYNPGCQVKNSLISSGCILNGTVEDSILFKQAYVGDGCVIKNSIIMHDAYIGDHAKIENCIVESHSVIKEGTTYTGTPEKIRVVIEKNVNGDV
jgi:glucose-1-phosphate adenylyltransferase